MKLKNSFFEKKEKDKVNKKIKLSTSNAKKFLGKKKREKEYGMGYSTLDLTKPRQKTNKETPGGQKMEVLVNSLEKMIGTGRTAILFREEVMGGVPVSACGCVCEGLFCHF